jgi:hypothetical protein
MISEIITYFAKFPQKENILQYFNTNAETISPAQNEIYTILYASIQALPTEPVIPELKGFLFGNTDHIIATYIKNIPSPYMLLLYPEIQQNATSIADINTEAHITIGIFDTYTPRNKNIFQEAAIMQHTYNICTQIIHTLIDDAHNQCPTASMIEPNSIQIVPDTLHHTIGYSIILNLKKSGT